MQGSVAVVKLLAAWLAEQHHATFVMPSLSYLLRWCQDPHLTILLCDAISAAILCTWRHMVPATHAYVLLASSYSVNNTDKASGAMNYN